VTAALAWECQRDRLADTLGRLRRRLAQDELSCFLVDRAAFSLEALDGLLEPTAGDLVRAGWDVDDALEVVDRHSRRLRSSMGCRP
jgi:hypothetical protein